VFERFQWVSSLRAPDDPRLSALDRRMRAYYAASERHAEYHSRSENDNQEWESPAQQRIRDLVQPGDRVVEFSCGSGYSSSVIRERGARYVGFDLPIHAILESDPARRRAGLLVGNGYAAPLQTSCADLVFSNYSLEHVVWPHRYLDEMIRVARPGGRIVLALPDYVGSGQELPSIRLGRSAGGVKDKLLSGRWFDAIQTYAERAFVYRPIARRFKRTILVERQVQFLVYLTPSCLIGPFERDNDAIYQASEDEVALYLQQRHCTIESRGWLESGSSNAFIVARVHKP
jgi:SAM-dependent methyltransferase